MTACLNGAAKLARRQRGEKKCSPRERGRKLEHRERSAVVVFFFLKMFFFFYTILTSTGRGASAVDNLGCPRYLDRQCYQAINYHLNSFPQKKVYE